MLEFTVPAALAILGFVPVVVALYFIRSRPRKHIVPSHRIWEEVLRRQRKDSLMGRFRNSIFLILHILLILLAALGLSQPTRSGGMMGDTLFLVDTSASMGATDVSGGRLAEARRKVREVLFSLDADARVSLIEAGIRVVPRVAATADRGRFLAELDRLEVSDGAGPDPGEIASVLRSLEEGGFARTYFYTDNAPLSQISEIPGLGRFRIETVGRASENLAVTSLEVLEGPQGKEASVRVRNFGPLPARCRVSLESSPPGPIQSHVISLKSGGETPIQFPRISPAATMLTVRISPTGSPDYLESDDAAIVVLDRPRRKVLLLDGAASPLMQVLSAKRLRLDLRRVEAANPYGSGVNMDDVDVIVSNGYHGPELEERNLLLFARPGPKGPASGPQVTRPELGFIDSAHPVMKYLSWDDVNVRHAAVLQPGGRSLISVAGGDLMSARETARCRQVIAGFPLSETDLPYRIAFPILVANALSWITGSSGLEAAELRAGTRVSLPGSGETATVELDGRKWTVRGVRQGGELVLDPFRKVGLHRVSTDRVRRLFAVNLLSLTESNIRPSGDAGLFGDEQRFDRGRQPIWRWFLWTFMAVLILEWLLWHRLGG